jgi:hypothetical protein
MTTTYDQWKTTDPQDRLPEQPEKNCSACRWSFFSDDMPSSVHQCRRHAPSLNQERWPLIEPSDWCGDFEDHPIRF